MAHAQPHAARLVVVDGGNAARCAAISARERRVDVVLLERAPEALEGGNSFLTAGAMWVAYTRSPAGSVLGRSAGREAAQFEARARADADEPTVAPAQVAQA